TIAVPRIVITDDEIDKTSSKHFEHHPSKVDKTKISYPTMTSNNMDNISLKNYISSSSCPESPTSSDKNSSTKTNPANLSPPGIPPTPTAISQNSGKRRGITHRSSYKRAHKGRL
ncbi:unnamed protein product, partial [Rotaria sp. Silwood1]